MGKLKSWWKDENDGSCLQSSFLRLYELSLTDCCKLTSFPPCPRVKKLHLGGLDENFQIVSSSAHKYESPMLRKVNVFENVSHLKSLPMSSVTSLSVFWDNKVERLSQVEDSFKSCSSSLRTLTIRGCENLRSVSRSLEYLTALESLSIIECPILRFAEEDADEDDNKPWRFLHRSLRSIELWAVDSMEILPQGMQYLTNLQSLTIENCWNFETLPEWISCLSSLNTLRVKCCRQFQSLPEAMRDLTSLKVLDLSYCKESLKERCQSPNGEYWPKIQHIPSIDTST
ncbi:disease resistance protein RGA2-like [Beta vulgaris subsp. vulgaris]|uniref:disease resistance protein RGA2-like n=1 Tax=Beta vulgaris subsp. vulgaris TaxID=3555 RepID=UPI0025475ED6|nr:disease resistance protein RGA2-like [Beta vulgaris subsp. vulgaris]